MTGGADLEALALDALIALAERLADAARAEVRPHYRTALRVEDKADASPVTAIDRASEAAMRRVLEREAPDHGVVGEEYGADRPDAEYVWVIDPIDGTKRFITGSPLFGCLVALLHRGRPLVGVIEMPALDERWVGAAGRPSLHRASPHHGGPFQAREPRAISTRPCPTLDAAALASSSPHMFAGADAAAYDRLRKAVKLPLYGGDCFNYALLADGFLDLVVEAGLGTYDFLALVPVIEGAGGRLTDWAGRALGLGSDGRVLASGDPVLHEAALTLLAGS